ncbi:hypothetical protein EHYA_09335 [Embleya hyalina]|uniref:Uncharacterized protein n=1 Tax=Embleya hyalina TaxID=516124 RepID=A0A401Z3Z3_9ACTN|nr:hypothetical protein EHYA_09335 [Embleya hyalina]
MPDLPRHGGHPLLTPPIASPCPGPPPVVPDTARGPDGPETHIDLRVERTDLVSRKTSRECRSCNNGYNIRKNQKCVHCGGDGRVGGQ